MQAHAGKWSENSSKASQDFNKDTCVALPHEHDEPGKLDLHPGPVRLLVVLQKHEEMPVGAPGWAPVSTASACLALFVSHFLCLTEATVVQELFAVLARLTGVQVRSNLSSIRPWLSHQTTRLLGAFTASFLNSWRLAGLRCMISATVACWILLRAAGLMHTLFRS